MIDVALSLQELASCPICADNLYPAHSLCRNGHGVCGNCRVKLRLCPTCQQDFVLERATLLNQIFEAIPTSCPFNDQGCQVMMCSKTHPLFCEFRPTSCKRNECLWDGPVKDLRDHILRVHDEEFVELSPEDNSCDGNYFFHDKSESSHCYTPLIYENNIFWKFYHRDGRTKRITHKFYHLPFSKPKHNYYLIVSFKSGDIEFSSSTKAVVNMQDDLKPSTTEEKSELLIPDSDLHRFQDPLEEDCFKYRMKVVQESV